MSDFEYQRLRKQYYQAYDIPFCGECGGTFHYDKDICEFVCDECGAVVHVSDRDRSKKGCKKKERGKCWYCGKVLTGRQKKFCSLKCNKLYHQKKNWNESIIKGKDLLGYFEQKNIDEDLEITEDDDKWGLGESSLNSKKLYNLRDEGKAIKREKRKIMGS